MIVTYHKKYSLYLATVFATAFPNSRVHQFMGGNAPDGHTLVVGEHPNYHIRNTILGLKC